MLLLLVTNVVVVVVTETVVLMLLMVAVRVQTEEGRAGTNPPLMLVLSKYLGNVMHSVQT